MEPSTSAPTPPLPLPPGYCLAGAESHTASSRGKAFLAMAGAMTWPGIGHFLAGSYYLGLFWFTLSMAIVVGLFSVFAYPEWIPALVVLAPMGALAHLVQLIDAARCARRSPSAMFWDPMLRFGTGAVLLGLAFVWQHRAACYLHENLCQLCFTPTLSMAPNLTIGDRFIALQGAPVQRWDIVILKGVPGYERSDDNLVKRIVGLPGDKVEITSSGVLINDKAVEPPRDAGPYAAVDLGDNPLAGPSPFAAHGCWGKPIFLGTDEYFVLGDNTSYSGDARFWGSIDGHQPGAVPANWIVSRVIAICWPLDRARLFRRDSTAP